MTLAAQDLAFGYRGHPVGQGVSLAVAAGEVLALLGPNGGGKTTLLKTLLGLIPPQAGSVMLDGRDLAAIPVRERARLVAYVPQSHHGTFAFTAFDVVLMGRTAHGGLFARPGAKDRAVAAAMLERLGIAHLSDRSVTMISGGERQLVLVARALAQEPRFIVLDEPTRASTSATRARSCGRSAASRPTGSACCSRRMTRTRRSAMPIAWRCCATAG